MTIPHDAQAADVLVERLAEDMAGRWRRGERPLVEDYLTRHPELVEVPEAALELISEEICLRQEHDEPVRATDLERRFPRWGRQVRALRSFHQAMEHGPAPLSFPAAGETLGEFHLLAEIGRGAHARVFLARQSALADRHVVLKVAAPAGQEHLCLARLQHGHIVPLYSAHDFPWQGLRGLCMPYFGGATLADLLFVLEHRPRSRRTGAELLDALRQLQEKAAVPIPVGGPACNFLARASWTRAVCWLGACLADALQYAQERGLVHLDVKPSNVLLAADGQPMLLDFHLAREVLPAGAVAPGWLGGTPGYMAPEHETALRAVAEGLPLSTAVDGRADVYALGRLLDELLNAGGEKPRGAVQALLKRCQAADPDRRYPSAADLAADLRHHLADRPLRGVPDRNPRERWRKWRRRRPAALPLLLLLLGVVTAAAALTSHAGRQADRARSALRDGDVYLAQQRWADALDSYRRGAALAGDLPLAGGLRRDLQQRQDRAERALAASELHVFCERVRPLYGSELLPQPRIRGVVEQCRRLWAGRDQLRRCLEEQPEAALREQARTDLLDLAIIWTHLAGRLASAKESAAAHREALAVLERAEQELGPSCVLHHERRGHAQALRRKSVADEALPPRGAWEHFALGRTLYQAGEWPEALRQLDRALELEPRAPWPTFYRGCCACRLGRYHDAVVDFSVCEALAGEQPWFAYNRGLAYLGLDRPEQALRDLQRALDGGLDGAALRYHQALAHLARQDRPAALASARQALRHDSAHADARRLVEHLLAER
jgi:serine/threonine protein kinase